MGNRRWGEGGFVQGGRRAAKARAMAPPSGKSKAGAPGKGASPPAAQPCSSYAEPAGSGTPHGKARRCPLTLALTLTLTLTLTLALTLTLTLTP